MTLYFNQIIEAFQNMPSEFHTDCSMLWLYSATITFIATVSSLRSEVLPLSQGFIYDLILKGVLMDTSSNSSPVCFFASFPVLQCAGLVRTSQMHSCL